MTAKSKAEITPVHLWTNGGAEVLVVRYVNGESKSYNDFQHPKVVGETVTAPDWDKAAVCGRGIHGWPWGMSLGAGKECDWDARWQVYGVKPEDVVLLDEGKVKFRTGVLRFIGDWNGALMFVLDGQMAWVRHAARGAASATGDRGAASATGYSGAASATGDRGAASATGDSGAASATGYSGAASATGYRGAASATGDRGAASATGYRGAASATGYSGAASATGASSAAVAGLEGRARAGEFGCIAIAWWNKPERRLEMRCARTGPGAGLLRPHVWYQLDAEGEFIEVAP